MGTRELIARQITKQRRASTYSYIYTPLSKVGGMRTAWEYNRVGWRWLIANATHFFCYFPLTPSPLLHPFLSTNSHPREITAFSVWTRMPCYSSKWPTYFHLGLSNLPPMLWQDWSFQNIVLLCLVFNEKPSGLLLTYHISENSSLWPPGYLTIELLPLYPGFGLFSCLIGFPPVVFFVFFLCTQNSHLSKLSSRLNNLRICFPR